jgi:hypothetical protein
MSINSATKGPFLDDVLVNTDPIRPNCVLSVLGAQAARLQIFIFTCPPDRYRGSGHAITFEACRPNNP